MLKIAVISDIHFNRNDHPGLPGRKRRFGLIFLKRVIDLIRLNHEEVDVVLLPGDLLDCNAAASSATLEELVKLRDILATLPVPYLAVPGNHDTTYEEFYRVMPAPPEFLEVKNTRIIPFGRDIEQSGYNYFRSKAEIERFARARSGFSGDIIALQHCTLQPENQQTGPYNYTNSAEIIDAMHRSGCTLAVSGHHHGGLGLISDENAEYITVPALCESPFSYAIIGFENGKVTDYKLESLRLPDGYWWFDGHTHTPYAYCCENMDLPLQNEMFELFNLSGAAITEHSGQLMYTRNESWQDDAWFRNCRTFPATSNRYLQYERYCRNFAAPDKFIFGLEVDVDACGVLIMPDNAKNVEFKLGAVHVLNEGPDCDKLIAQNLFLINALARNGIRVLAHPLRLLLMNNVPSEMCYRPIVETLKKCNMAAELNFHGKPADIEFTKLCLEHGVKLSLGTDSHNIANFGRLQPHIKMLNRLGVTANYEDIIFNPLYDVD